MTYLNLDECRTCGTPAGAQCVGVRTRRKIGRTHASRYLRAPEVEIRRKPMSEILQGNPERTAHVVLAFLRCL